MNETFLSPARARSIASASALALGLSACSGHDDAHPSPSHQGTGTDAGSADAAHQTPPHIFERALFTLVARLIAGGCERIVVVGVIPEPFRETQSEIYQERVARVVQQHHINGVDILHLWTNGDAKWIRRFSASGNPADETLGGTPNAGALEEIVQQIQSRL